MTVDCHVNIWEERHALPSFAAQLGRVRQGEVGLKADADTLYRAMAGVDRAIVFALRYGDSIGIESDDETTAAAVAKYPDKLIGFAYVDPRRPAYLEELRYAVETLGLRGVKYGPIYNGVPLDDPRMEPVYRYCIANDLPLTLHMGTTYTAQSPIDLGRPIHVEPIARRFPDLTIVMAHMGHPWCEECIVVTRKQPRVFAEISALHYRPWQFYNMLIAAQEYRVVDKLFFGTDFPFTTVEESLAGLRGVNRQVEGTALPRVGDATIEGIIQSDPLRHWWRQPPATGTKPSTKSPTNSRTPPKGS
jgi:predicted TIM-barrel fold metal-dependent hydrolase